MHATLNATAARRLRAVLRWLPALAWAGLIFLLSAQPEPLGRQPGAAQSLLAHAAVYAVLAALLLLAAGGPGRARWRTYAAVLLAASLYGVSDELHQAFVPGRTPDPVDWAVDTAGAAAALALLRLLGRRPPPVLGRLRPRGRHQDIAE
ncbi:MAG TPA: VanZ family protein [Dehalococcoidia bacterium]